jgi:serine protease
MKYILTILLLVAIVTGAWAEPPTIPGRLVLKLKPGATLAAILPALPILSATDLSQKFPHATPPNPEIQGSVDLGAIYQFQVPTPANLAKARAVLLGTGAVEYVEPLYIREPLYQPNDPLSDSTNYAQYYLRLIKAYRAWDITKGDTTMVIGIVDTGMRPTHEDLVHQIKYNYADPINGVDDDKDGYIDNFRGWDMANGNNDPTYNDDHATHGSQVAGVAAAQTDNGKGVAGVGFSCKFLPIQIFAGTTTGTFAGYEGIAYAADHGCKVINMSWGGAGGYSRFEQDVCTYATVNKDAVLVAAAGNTNAELTFYPASYDHVLSVAATDGSDAKAGFATYSRSVGIAAPGAEMRVVNGLYTYSYAGNVDSDYWVSTGSSVATPQVSGAAALVRVRFPQLTAEQVQAQLRQSADTAIYSLPANAAYRGKLGSGRLNVARAVAALQQREARIVTSTFAPARPTGYAPGDTMQLAIGVRNLLLPVTGLTVTVTSLSPYLAVRRGSFAAGALATRGETSNAAQPFRLAVAASVPYNTQATLRYRLTAAGGYQTDQFVTVLLHPDFVQLDAGDLVASITTRGNLAYDESYDQGGLGVSYRASGPLLSEGGLLLATSATRVADRLHTTQGMTRQSFYSQVPIRKLLPGPRADQEAYSVFRDSLPNATQPRSVGVRVRQRGLSWAAPAARRDFIILEYAITNVTADTLKPLYAGVFTDWDLPGESTRNVARYDSVQRIGYSYDPLVPRVYAGVQVLGTGPAGVYSIDNSAPATAPIYFKDGFSPAEKYLALSAGFTKAHRDAGTDPKGADVSQVLSTKIARLAPGDSATIAFAVLAAPTLAQLQAAAQAATAAYFPTNPLATTPTKSLDIQVYPNPSHDQVQVLLPLSFGPATAHVLDALGREVSHQALGVTGGELQIGKLAPGLYTLRITGANGSAVRQLVRE